MDLRRVLRFSPIPPLPPDVGEFLLLATGSLAGTTSASSHNGGDNDKRCHQSTELTQSPERYVSLWETRFYCN